MRAATRMGDVMSFTARTKTLATPISLLGAALIFLPTTLSAAELPEDGESRKPEKECYMSYSDNKDHMVMGCEVDGYHMRYDLAQQGNLFMVMLPDGIDSVEKTPVLFMTTTYPLNGRSLIRLFEDDLEGVLNNKPGTTLVRKILKETPANMGECAGAEITVTAANAHFPYQRYFFCKNGSDKYSILVSVITRTKRDLNEHYEGFVKWANVPQVVTDHKTTIVEEAQ